MVVVFLYGFFWRRMSTQGAFAVLLGSVVFNVALKFGMPDVPFILRIWLVTLACMAAGLIVSVMTSKEAVEVNPEHRVASFATDNTFNVLSAIIVILLTGTYVFLW